MLEKNSGLPLVYLATSQCIVTKQDCLISTTLGSCVAVILYCSRLTLGGICHAFLPKSTDYCMRPAQDCEPCRYADEAVHHLLARFAKRGAVTSEITARVYGGASRMTAPMGNNQNESQTIGARNAEVAITELQHAGLGIEYKDVGGTAGRRLLFSPSRGVVQVQRLTPSALTADTSL